MKKKTIELNGYTFLIAPLNAAQVEEITEQIEQGDQQQANQRVWRTIENSLNNAISRFDRGARVYPDGVESIQANHVKCQLGYVEMGELHGAILELSGLTVTPKGEAPAATESTSATSVAA